MDDQWVRDDESLNELLGLMLKHIRANRDLPVHDTCLFADISPEKLALIEKGQANISTAQLFRLCKTYGFSPDYFYYPIMKPEWLNEELKKFRFENI